MISIEAISDLTIPVSRKVEGYYNFLSYYILVCAIIVLKYHIHKEM